MGIIFLNKFTKKYFNKNVLITVSNENQANLLLKIANSFNYKWFSSQSFLDHNNYKYFKNKTYYNIYKGTCGNISDIHLFYNNYLIYSFDEFINEYNNIINVSDFWK